MPAHLSVSGPVGLVAAWDLTPNLMTGGRALSERAGFQELACMAFGTELICQPIGDNIGRELERFATAADAASLAHRRVTAGCQIVATRERPSTQGVRTLASEIFRIHRGIARDTKYRAGIGQTPRHAVDGQLTARYE